MPAQQEAYNQLCGYTLTRGDPAFIHQHIVDAYAAQRADERSKPIGVVFALVGLYLHVEKQFSGRQVQRVHMLLARRKHDWPAIPLPLHRGAITAVDVMSAPAGPQRDRAIDAWCASVWEAFAGSRQIVIALLEQHGIGTT